MKLRVEVDGQDYSLELQKNGADSNFRLEGVSSASGVASVTETTPGTFSVLLGARSFTVNVVPDGDALEVWTGGERHRISIADARDRPSGTRKRGPAGPMEVRAQMPGKVIKLLVQSGSPVQVGQGLIVVEAMKMQNEMKSPKEGIVSKIYAVEGATVAAGEVLIVVE